jgi:phage gp36-like protein
MPWISITPATIGRGFAAAELSALRTVQTAPEGDPTTATIAAVVEEVRGYVAACSKNSLGPAGTIPARLEASALDVVRWRLLSRLPVQSMASDARRKAYEDAISMLRQVARCEFAVDIPETVSESAGDAKAGVVGSTRPRIPRPPL